MLNAMKMTLIGPRHEIRRLFEGAGIVSVKEVTMVILTPRLEDKIAEAVAKAMRSQVARQGRRPSPRTSKPARRPGTATIR